MKQNTPPLRFAFVCSGVNYSVPALAHITIRGSGDLELA